ncbi:hypothetical protein LNP04_01045 [Chryseobacterium sp. C-71]|uniref:hypothetical protein n=1 Tax=Chryseobacterium sp. C-71 TaxID=2893882 RepID=UPI001E41A805|nr:hypothetical protein [Chryseobacterium sp. C-71]UFH32321.1 hypothetical protein LNP04_01045 [Chryseobacterium sp. C-71]
MKSTNDKKKKVINDLVKKKIDGLQKIYGGIGCTVPPKPIVVNPPKCYICLVTPPKDPNGPVQA